MSSVRVIGLFNGNELFGQEKANIRVFEALRAGGMPVTVGVNAKESGGAVGRDLRARGFETFDIPFGFQWSKQFFKKQPSLIFRNLRYVVRASTAFQRAFRRIQPTHVHLGNPLAYSFVAPMLAMKRCKLIYRMGDEPPHESPANMWIWKSAATKAHRIVANSKFVQASILRCRPAAASKLSLIYNIAPCVEEPTMESADSLPPMFLFTGQISEHKGVFHFLEAAIQICQEFPVVRFSIAGGSPYTIAAQEAIQNRIVAEGLSDRIEMHGYVSDMGSLYRAATALVVPSLFEEPAANVVLEAKSHGTPAIVYPSGGLPELVSDGITGWVCSQKSTVELVQRMRSLLNEQHQLTGARVATVRAACVREAQEQFGVERFEREWQEIYTMADSKA